jgi:hypothetical protein
MAQTLTSEIINAAIEGFESQKTRIDVQIAELRAMLDGNRTTTTASIKRKGRTISAAGRARIAEAQRRRWAASRGESESITPEPSKPKRKLSSAGRAAIVTALKKRWAAKRAEAAKTAPTAVKKKGVKTSATKARKRTARRRVAAKKTPAAQVTTQPAA